MQFAVIYTMCLSMVDTTLLCHVLFVILIAYRSNNSVAYTVGSTVQFECNGVNDDTFTGVVVWTKDGTVVDNSASFNVFVLNNDLWIFRMTAKDTGEYACAIEGSMRDVYHLTVEGIRQPILVNASVS